MSNNPFSVSPYDQDSDSGILNTGEAISIHPFDWNISLSTTLMAFLSNAPIIYTIERVWKYSENKYIIEYKGLGDYIPAPPPEGSLYFNNSKTTGVYFKGDHKYWVNCITVEFNKEEFPNLVEGETFSILNLWDQKITNEEILKCLSDKVFYYSYIHSLLEEYDTVIYKTKKDLHTKLDEILGLDFKSYLNND